MAYAESSCHLARSADLSLLGTILVLALLLLLGCSIVASAVALGRWRYGPMTIHGTLLSFGRPTLI